MHIARRMPFRNPCTDNDLQFCWRLGTLFAERTERFCVAERPGRRGVGCECDPRCGLRAATVAGPLIPWRRRAETTVHRRFIEVDAEREGDNLMAKAAVKEKSKIKLVPLGDRVVVKREEAEETTTGGIVLPDTAKDKPQRGEVVAVGDGHVKDDGTKVPLTVKEGDKIIFSSYAGDEITIGDEEYLLLRESDILATYE